MKINSILVAWTSFEVGQGDKRFDYRIWYFKNGICVRFVKVICLTFLRWILSLEEMLISSR